jgi:hypothetical protein
VSGGTPIPTPTPVAVQVSGEITGYSRRSHGYYLIGRDRDAVYTATLAPSLDGGQLTFEWHGESGTGSWTTVSQEASTTDGTGSASLVIPHAALTPRTPYRIWAYYSGDADHSSASTGYLLFRIARR